MKNDKNKKIAAILIAVLLALAGAALSCLFGISEEEVFKILPDILSSVC